MKVLISELPEEGLDVAFKETVESDSILSPISAQLKIMKIGSEVAVRGEVIADVRLQCSRCLSDFEQRLSVPVDVVYRPLEELKGEERHEIMVGELDMDFYSGDEMDLATLIKEQVLLQMLYVDVHHQKPSSARGACDARGQQLQALPGHVHVFLSAKSLAE